MMDYSRLLTLMAFLAQVGHVVGQACNMTQAAACVVAMEKAMGRVLESASGVTKQETLQRLCLDVIKGNNLTQCYLEATGGCDPNTGESPTSAMQNWERVMQDLYQMCDGACPNFLERTVNITQCTSLIRFDELYDNSYLSFCNSLNASLKCSQEVSGECKLFSQLFYDLLPNGIDQTANTICSSGCDNFDGALRILESCKTYVSNLPEDLDAACSAYRQFRTCLRVSDVPLTCPMFGALMDVLYPQHIFGLYEQQCNITEDVTTPDGCGERGVAKIDHCLRIFAIAWPSGTDSKLVTQQHCSDFKSAMRCLEKSSFNECPSLQQYFSEQTESRQKYKAVLEHECSNLSEVVESGTSAEEKSVAMLTLTCLATALSLGILNG